MEILVNEFTNLARLKGIVPKRTSPHPPSKSEIVPMKVLFNDEKKTSETILILQQIAHDAELDGRPQVCCRIDHLYHNIMKLCYINFYTDCYGRPVNVQEHPRCKTVGKD